MIRILGGSRPPAPRAPNITLPFLSGEMKVRTRAGCLEASFLGGPDKTSTSEHNKY